MIKVNGKIPNTTSKIKFIRYALSANSLGAPTITCCKPLHTTVSTRLLQNASSPINVMSGNGSMCD